MSHPQPNRPPKKAVSSLSLSCILLTMILALALASLAGCAGSTAPSNLRSAHASTAPEITTSSLPAGPVGASYSEPLAATGGAPPYTWSIRGGSLPSGLLLNLATGTIAGTPASAGVYSFKVEVQDSKYVSAFAGLSVAVSPPGPRISGISPSNGLVTGGTAVTINGSNFQPASGVMFGNTPAISVQVVNDTLIRCITPAGSVGVVGVTVQGSNSQAATVQSAFTFSAPPLEITTTSLPPGSVGATYKTTLSATGGVPPYTWSAFGVLPGGTQLTAASGVISGVPTKAGSYSFAAQVTDTKSTSSSANISLGVSPDPAPIITSISPNSGPTAGGTVVTISGSNFQSAAVVKFGSIPASSVQVINSTQIQAVAPAETSATVNVSAQGSNGQTAIAANAFAFVAPTVPATPSADVIADASQTVSETGGDDLAAAKNIYASASSPESNGGLSDWGLISSEFAMKRMRNINGLGDCALGSNGNLTGCSRLDNDLNWIKQEGLTPHVVVGQWAPASIPGDPRQWGASQWAQYDALSYAIVNHVANQYGGTGFTEALFEVENEIDITTSPQDLWLTSSSIVPQYDPSRFAQYDTVYRHWAAAVNQVAQQNPSKKIRIAAQVEGLGPHYEQVWNGAGLQKYAAQGVRFDVLAFHIYGNNTLQWVQAAQQIRSTLSALGKNQVEIWITEWGASYNGDSHFGMINATHQGASWAIGFLLSALRGAMTGGSFLQVRDNQGTDTAGVNSNIYLASWNHVTNSIEYPKVISNAFSMVDRMEGTRKALTVNPGKPDLYALSSSDSTSASLIVANYNYDFTNASDLSTNENVTVAFQNLPFSGPVTVDRYLIDAQTSNLYYWTTKGISPPSVQATQLQKVESFSGNVSSGAISLPARQLGPSAVSMWILHQ
jgi:IPT/TIG domain/Putative Ig domain